MTRASVVIPSHGGAARLPGLMDRLARQTHPDWEAIVVIDGDRDGSAEIIRRYADLPVRCVVFPVNRGRVAALNAGFAAADGDILIRCDDDFELGDEHIAAHVAAHASRPCGVIGPTHNIAPDNPYVRAYGADIDRRSAAAMASAAPTDRWRFWGGNTSVPRSIFDRVGGFCDAYDGYGWEDLDFGYRLDRLGIPIILDKSTAVGHHLASVSTVIRADRAFRSGRARRTFDRLHGANASSSAGSASIWSLVVALTSHAMPTARPVARFARAADHVAGLAPPVVARKTIALVVEAAAVSGYRSAAGDPEEVAP